jgi:formate hydrogenlyase subunit 6/NADH:ubiquinone oxidoreductase subunit I
MSGQVSVVDRSGRGALASAARGLWVSIRHMADRRTPSHASASSEPLFADSWWESGERPAAFRGVPALQRDANGEPRCTRCGACEQICPSQCIRVEHATDSDASTPDEARGSGSFRFELDLSRCMFCGLCVDVCPDEAIAMSGQIAGASFELAAHRLSQPELLALDRRLPTRLERPPLREAGTPWQRTHR